MRHPPIPVNIDKRRKIRAIDGKVRYFTILDEIVREQKGVERGTCKQIYLQKLRYEDTGKIAYRFTYYMLGLKAGARGRWVFGQYSLLIPASDLRMLLAAARKRGWQGF